MYVPYRFNGNMGLYEQEECLHDSDIETIGTIVIYNINGFAPVSLVWSLLLIFILEKKIVFRVLI